MSWASHIDITIRHKIDISSINRPSFWLQILDFANISSLRTQSAFHTLKTLRQSKFERPNLEFYGYFSLEIVLYILTWKYTKVFFNSYAGGWSPWGSYLVKLIFMETVSLNRLHIALLLFLISLLHILVK